MDVILVPGLWLDATSWRQVIPIIERAGHRAIPLTLPGVGVPAPLASAIGIADWVDAVVALIDDAPEPVALVGHSGGGNVVWGAADARPERIAHVVFVDTVPPAPGMRFPEFEAVDGVVPFPGWEVFAEPDVYDVDAQTRADIAAHAKSVPIKTTSDGIALSNTARYAVPITVLSGALDDAELRERLRRWPAAAAAAEFAAIADATVVKIDSGHWPQFTRPEALGAAVVAAVALVPHPEATVDGDDGT